MQYKIVEEESNKQPAQLIAKRKGQSLIILIKDQEVLELGEFFAPTDSVSSPVFLIEEPCETEEDTQHTKPLDEVRYIDAFSPAIEQESPDQFLIYQSKNGVCLLPFWDAGNRVGVGLLAGGVAALLDSGSEGVRTDRGLAIDTLPTPEANESVGTSNVQAGAVTGTNEAPVAVDDSFTVAEDTTTAALDLLANDTDVEGSTLSIVSIGGITLTPGTAQTIAVTNGTVNVSAAGVITFTPAANYNGPVSFDYVVTDGTTQATGTVSGTVTAVNDAPVAANDSFTVAEDGTSAALDLLANDTDVDGNTLSIVSIGGTTLTPGTAQTISVTNGTVSVSNTGVITFTPDANYNGPVSFDYVVTDGTSQDTGTVSGTVTAVNDAPVAVDDSVNVDEDSTSTVLNLLANDTDVDGNTLSIVSIGGTTLTPGTAQTIAVPNGTVNVSAAGVITFTPDANYNGAVSFDYVVTDGTSQATGTVSGTVTAVDDASIPSPDTKTVLEDNAATGNVLINDSDVDNTLSVASFTVAGDATVYTFGQTATITNQGTLTIASNGAYTFTPVVNWNGVVPQVTYTTNTGSSSTLDITVTPVNDQPISNTSFLFFTTPEDSGAPVNNVTQGTAIKDLTNIQFMEDAEGVLLGLAFVGPVYLWGNPNPANSLGVAWYSTDEGNTWLNLETATASASLTNAFVLNSSTRLYFEGDLDQWGTLEKSTVRLWDETDNAANASYVNTTGKTGLIGAYSSSNIELHFAVSSVNDAPYITFKSSNSITVKTGVSRIYNFDFSDVDSDFFTVELSVTNGILTLNEASAPNLTATGNNTNTLTITGTGEDFYWELYNNLSYKSNAGYIGSDSLTIKITDDGAAEDNTPKSHIEIVPINVTAPIVLDLNQDGTIEYTTIQMDVNDDGILDTTGWVGASDGILVWDQYGDGSVRESSQYIFSRNANETDLQGLAAQFDSNQDGIFDSRDEKFNEFSVWQDVDQDGFADAGEVKSLQELGITSVHLTSDGIQRTPETNIIEAGQSSATLADGSSMLIADAMFMYSAFDSAYVATLSNDGVLTYNTENTVIDLTSYMANQNTANIKLIDLTGTGNNAVNISISDVLQIENQSQNNPLFVKGDAGDAVSLFTGGQLFAQDTRTVDGQTYQAFDMNNNGLADLLVQNTIQIHII
jgi:hypothetical protein